uniref:Uncharacterized protein LOC104241344 n=1 Tax=Nicotiana sylvestris TaxID=4096 RepID=A0A1U7XR90_NICSY|nr:PREDICTED: uncharacterized protein LOC104241344 [Nicotiana sylvestris]
MPTKIAADSFESVTAKGRSKLNQEARRNMNRIFSITDSEGIHRTDMDAIAKAFIDFYTKLLGTSNKEREHVNSGLVRQGQIVTAEQREMLEAEFTENEVKRALWAINSEKLPGPDDYGSKFFKDSWDVVGKNVMVAVLEFFQTGEMLKVLNHTVITVIPKSSHATNMGDYGPIAGCNTV